MTRICDICGKEMLEGKTEYFCTNCRCSEPKTEYIPEIKSANDRQPKCPKCGSTHIGAHKKGYSPGKGCCAGLIALPISILMVPFGLLCGAVGANDMERHCLNCGYTW